MAVSIDEKPAGSDLTFLKNRVVIEIVTLAA
jgi:hypothetical protein